MDKFVTLTNASRDVGCQAVRSASTQRKEQDVRKESSFPCTWQDCAWRYGRNPKKADEVVGFF